MEETAQALGLLHQGVLVLDSNQEMSVLSDACLYDWYQDGVNTVERYAETHPQTPGSAEAELLDAYGRAVYRLIRLETAVPGAGVHCRDLLTGEELFVMDSGLSRTPADVRLTLATRTIPLGDFWMTGGAALPVSDGKQFLDKLEERIRSLGDQANEPGALPLACIRTCLETGSAEHIRFQAAGSKSGLLAPAVERTRIGTESKWAGKLPPKRRRRRLSG
jgi:hypothetical protein